MKKPILSVRGIRAYYHIAAGAVKAVDDVSFELQEGEILSIAGESGCGKTTLAYSILRLLRPPGYIEGGEVIFKDIDLLKQDQKSMRKMLGKRLSLIPQNSMHVLNPVTNIHDQMADTFKAHSEKGRGRGRKRISKKEITEKITELLINVGLSPSVTKMYPHELSGGMRQRVVIATAIALNPELVIADEPTTALDVIVQRGVLQLISDLKRDLNLSLIVVTHDMGVHAQIGDRLCIMYAGKISELGPTSKLFKEPLHPYSNMLISSIPSLDKTKRISGIKGAPPRLIDPPTGCRFHPRCPHTMEKCRLKQPEMLEVEPERFVACHLR